MCLCVNGHRFYIRLRFAGDVDLDVLVVCPQCNGIAEIMHAEYYREGIENARYGSKEIAERKGFDQGSGPASSQ
jgi:hypothetical protein